MSEVDSTLRRIKNAKKFAEEKLKTAKTVEEREDAEDLRDFVNKLVTQMCEYTESVFRDNTKNLTRSQLSKEMDRKEFQDYCEGLERNRKISHDALITQVKMTDELCEELGIEPIYGKLPERFKNDTSLLMGSKNREKDGVVETRHAIADWTWDVVIGSTVALYIDVRGLDYNSNKEDMNTITESYHRDVGGKIEAKKLIDEMTESER